MSKLTSASEMLKRYSESLTEMRVARKHLKEEKDYSISAQVRTDIYHSSKVNIGKIVDFTSKNNAMMEVVNTLLIKMLDQSIEEIEREINELACDYLEILNGEDDGD